VNPIVSRTRRAKGSQNNAPTTFAEATVNTVLWIVQVLWGVFFSVTDFGKVLCYDPALRNQALQEVPWLSAVQQTTGVKPKLTPFGAFGLTLVMLLAALFNIVRGEYNFVPINLVLGGIAAFIVYGRLFVRPIAPVSISTFRVPKGARGSRRAGPSRFCSGLVQVDTYSLTLVSHRSAAGIG